MEHEIMLLNDLVIIGQALHRLVSQRQFKRREIGSNRINKLFSHSKSK